MNYTEAKISELLDIARKAGLKMPKEMLETPPAQLVKICNGVGSASLPEAIRKKLTAAYKCAEATAAIHDFRYWRSDGTPEAQRAADLEFLENGMAEVKHRHPNWRGILRRLWDERKIVAAFRILEICGESQWCVDFRNNVLNINKG